MNQFKEWLSDNLRYFILLAALALGAAAIVLGVGMYKAYREKSEIVSEEANLQTEITVRANGETGKTQTEAGLPAEVSQEKTEAPEPKTEAPEVKTEAAEVKTEAPKEKTEASEAKTEAPEEKTEASEVKTEAPEEKTEASEAKTEAPEEKTEKETEKETPAQTEVKNGTNLRQETETAKNETSVSEKETQESLPQTLPIKIEKPETESERESETQSETRKEFEIANLQIETNAPRKPAESETQKRGSSSDDVLVGVSEQKLASAQTETQSQTLQTQASETQPVTEPPTETQPETQPQTEEIDTLYTYNSASTLYASTSLNVRSGPGTEYGVLGDTDQGNELTVTGETSSWYQVSYDGQTGYVNKNLLVTEYIPVYRTMTGTCYMRSEPDYGDNIIGEYGAGTTVEFLGDVGGWYKVRIDGMTGYMGTRFFE